MQDRGGQIKNVFQKAGITITDALSMEYSIPGNPFDKDDL